MRRIVNRFVSQANGNESGFSLMELLVAMGIMAAIAAVTVPLVTKFAGSGESGAKKAELSNVQTAFDTLLGEGVVGSVATNTGALVDAVSSWTGLPDKTGGAAIQVGGVDADLTDYMRLSGAGGNETTYAYCWDAKGTVTQKDKTTPATKCS